MIIAIRHIIAINCKIISMSHNMAITHEIAATSQIIALT